MVYKKILKETKLTVEDVINEIAPDIVERGNKNGTWYKLVYDEVCKAIFDKYEFDWHEEIYSKIWDYFYNHNIQYHDKYEYLKTR